MDAEATPLYRFDIDGKTIETFKNYSLTGAGARLPVRLLVKNGVMAAIDPSMPAAADGVILDTAADTGDSDGVREIMTVLDGGGMLADLEEPITLPKGFDTTGIAELSDTLYSDLPIAMVRYRTGRAAAFNYLTGEEIELAQSRGVSSGGIIEYAKTFLSLQRVSLLSGISGGYEDLRAYENLIDAGALPSGTGGVGSAGSSGLTADTPGTGGEADTSGIGDVLGSGDADIPEESGAVDTPEVGGAENAGAMAAGDNAAGADKEAPASAGSGETGGDLSRNTAPERSLVSVYNFEKGAYDVYDASDLLTSANPVPVAELDYADEAQVKVLRDLADQGYEEPVSRGLLAMIVLFGAVAALLVCIYLVRRRLISRRR
jgi:hypothetical protein